MMIIDFFAKQLINNIIVIKSVSKMLSESEEGEHQDE
jgi:hypothetical protein